MRIRTTILTGMVAMAASLAMSTAAQAAYKDAELGSLGSGQLSNPVGVAVDQATHGVYVASLLGARVDEFNPSGSLVAPPSPFGTSEHTFSGLSIFTGVAFDQVDGDVYVVDGRGEAIQTYDGETGGGPLSEFSVAGSANLDGIFTSVQIASDSAGNVYFPNAPNNEVQEFSSNGTLLQTITGSGANALSAPTGVAVDAAGDIFVADSGNNRIVEFKADGTFMNEIASPGVQALALDAAGNIYAAENSGSGFHVVVYSASGVQLSEFGQGTIGSSEFGSINTLAVDQETGSVYVTDGGNNVVWIYGPPVLFAEVTTGAPATNVAATTATIAGVVNPDETSVTRCRFEYGTSTSYLASAPCSVPAPLTGNTAVAQSASLVDLQPDTTYHYRLTATSGNGTNYGEDETFTTESAIPSLDNVSASAVTQTSAILNASVNPNHQDTTYHFDFGSNSEYGTMLPAPDADIGSGYGDVVVGQELSGLTPGTTYHYRVVATNETGPATGIDETFTTLPPTPPIVNPGPAGEITSSAATLTGSVNPQGVQSTYEFDLGTDTSYGSRIFGEAGSAATPQTFTSHLNGLAPNTTYHYRLLATNVFGTTYGPDQTFTTPSVPSSLLTPPAAAVLVPTPQIGNPPAKSKATTPAKKPAQKKKKPKAKQKAKAKKPAKGRK
ncbi:MAG TPA: NHL repeat-containing protein [Solirubrobacteraceae bacterium]|jgi:sugar lactone lactonase YvrE|nr:NHL repeat-containing protein [Solirubrobacteraceae bacterium]